MRQAVVKVSSGNRLALPQDIADQAGIKVGDYIWVYMKDGFLHIQKVDFASRPVAEVAERRAGEA